MRAVEIPNFDGLTDLERLALAEEILSSLRAPEALPAPIVHRVEIERRWAAYEADPTIALSMAQFRNQIFGFEALIRDFGMCR